MKNLWGEITKAGVIKLTIAGLLLIAATATATYLVTERPAAKAPEQANGLAHGVVPERGAPSNPTPGQPGELYTYDPSQGFVPVSQQENTSPSEAAKPVAKEKEVIYVPHVHQASTSSSESKKEAGAFAGISKTTKGALIGGVLGASGGALMGGRGKHKAANGALVGGAIGAVAGGILGKTMEKSSE